jgi:hypothetical protein
VPSELPPPVLQHMLCQGPHRLVRMLSQAAAHQSNHLRHSTHHGTQRPTMHQTFSIPDHTATVYSATPVSSLQAERPQATPTTTISSPRTTAASSGSVRDTFMRVNFVISCVRLSCLIFTSTFPLTRIRYCKKSLKPTTRSNLLL